MGGSLSRGGYDSDDDLILIPGQAQRSLPRMMT